MADVIMPKMGDAMEEGVIVQWLKNVGDTVGPDDAIAEIETDKSNVELQADSAGTIQALKFKAGDTVPVGQVIAVIGTGAAAAAPSPATEPVAPQPPVTTPPPSNNNGTSASTSAAPVTRAEPAPVAVSVPPTPVVTAPSTFKPYDSFVGALPQNLGGSASLIGEPIALEAADGNGTGANGDRVRATPVARAMAQSHNLDLAALRGSGPDGAVAKRDVEAALANGTASSAAPVAASAPTAAPGVNDGDEVQEYNAMRRTIARRLSESKSTIPHFYVTAEIDMEAMLALREQVNAGAGDSQPKITLNDFIVKAVAVALVENPVINSAFSENKRILRKAINIGVAVSIDDGLIVPVVRNCESKSLRAIARDTRPLIEKARTGKLGPNDYTGGTFTISNLGQYDVENFAAIINPGEGAILAIGSIRPVPAVVGNQVVPRKRMNVTLCADHRVMDGVAGAVFLQSLKRVLENPLQILV